MIIVGLPFGIYRIWRERANAAVLALTLAAMIYPLVQLLRLSPEGGETAERSTEYLYVGISLVLAIGLAQFRGTYNPRRVASLVLVGGIAILFLGGFIAGAGPPWNYTPGPYLVSADPRSINRESVMDAAWMYTALGPGHRVASDRINRMLIQSYGHQWVVTGPGDSLDVAPLFMSLQFGEQEANIIQQGKVRYVVVDKRLSEGLPAVGVYFEDGEPDANEHTTPIPLEALTKFDNIYLVNRFFDSGNIVMYDTGVLVNAPKSVDLIVVSLFAAAAVTLADVGALNGPVGVLVGLPIVLIVPGHAIAAVIFPPQSRHPIERLTISMGLSLVMVILCALILDLTPAGMTTASWALCLASVTILAAILAYWRRETRPPAEAARTGTSRAQMRRMTRHLRVSRVSSTNSVWGCAHVTSSWSSWRSFCLQAL